MRILLCQFRQALPAVAAVQRDLYVTNAAIKANSGLQSNREGIPLPLGFQLQRIRSLMLCQIRIRNGRTRILRTELTVFTGGNFPACELIAETLRRSQGQLAADRRDLCPCFGRKITFRVLIVCQLCGFIAQIKGHAHLSGLHLSGKYQCAVHSGRGQFQKSCLSQQPAGKHITRKGILRQGTVVHSNGVFRSTVVHILDTVGHRPIRTGNRASVILICNGIIPINICVGGTNDGHS